jgi:DNA-binding response OmpR family regulator
VQKKGQILVVEPDDLILGLLQCWLGEAGYTVIVEGAKRLTRPDGVAGEPCLVIIDVPTPRAPGQLIRSVREVYASPILLLSARLRRGTGASSYVARQLGVRKVLPKPFTRDELLAAVSDSIDSH